MPAVPVVNIGKNTSCYTPIRVATMRYKQSVGDARSFSQDDSRGRLHGGRIVDEGDRGLRFVRYEGSPSKILGIASAFSVGLSVFRDTESPLMLKSYAVTMSKASKRFAHERVYFDSKLKSPLSCRGMARFPFSCCCLSNGKENNDTFLVPL